MALPTVTVEEKIVLLGSTINGTDLLSFADDDGDFVTKFRVMDENADGASSFLNNNGVIVPPNTWVEIVAANLNLLTLNSGTSIQSGNFLFQAFSNGEWGDVVSEMIYTVRENTTAPVVEATDISVIQSEVVLLSDFISAYDPDGYPIKRYKIFDSNPGPTSAGIYVDGMGELPAGVWVNLWPHEFATAQFQAAEAAPNNDPIWIRAFDRYTDGDTFVDGIWSPAVNINGFTQLNFNRPVGIPTETFMATEEFASIASLFGWTDADPNTLKRARFYDTTIHGWSGALHENGVELAGGQWVEYSAAELANVQWKSADRNFTEQVRFQVFDGNHWSDVETFRVLSNEKPILGVAEDYSIRQQHEFVSISDLILKLDNGPVHEAFQIFDSNELLTSGDFRLGASTYAAGQIHDVTAEEFFDLEFKSGVYEARSTDEVYVRAFNGTFWSDWTRHTIRTEPEYLDSLAAGSWLNFRPQQGGLLPMTFSFMQSYPSYGGGIEEEFVSPWPELRAHVRQIFPRMEEVVNIDFEEVADSVNGPHGLGGDIRLGTYCEADTGVAAYAFFPNAGEIGGDIWLNRYYMGASATHFTDAQDPPCGHPTAANPPVIPPGFFISVDDYDKGSSGYATIIHELGHAMGLKHPHDGSPLLPGATDSGFFTHMSYNSPSFPEWGQQIYDIAALQSIYGSNPNHAPGDTVYNSDTWRGSFNVVDSIWDTGGIDTIDASDQGGGAQFDIRPGGFNLIGAGSISVAFNVDIENVIGTSGGDSIIGNELANTLTGHDGDDVFEGYGGNDMLSGGAGNDRYIFKMFDGHNIIDEQLGAGRDTIEMGTFLGMDDFATDVTLTREGFDMIIDFKVDQEISRGSVRVVNQGFGRNRIETLDFFGTPVDLNYAFANITQPGQAFNIDTDNMLQYGFAVTPVA